MDKSKGHKSDVSLEVENQTGFYLTGIQLGMLGKSGMRYIYSCHSLYRHAITTFSYVKV